MSSSSFWIVCRRQICAFLPSFGKECSWIDTCFYIDITRYSTLFKEGKTQFWFVSHFLRSLIIEFFLCCIKLLFGQRIIANSNSMAASFRPLIKWPFYSVQLIEITNKDLSSSTPAVCDWLYWHTVPNVWSQIEMETERWLLNTAVWTYSVMSVKNLWKTDFSRSYYNVRLMSSHPHEETVLMWAINHF